MQTCCQMWPDTFSVEQDVEHVGQQGDVVELKFGYVYNYLVPTKRVKLVPHDTAPSKAATVRCSCNNRYIVARPYHCMQVDADIEAHDMVKRVRQLDATLVVVLSTTLVRL